MKLSEYIAKIKPLDADAMQAARLRQDTLTKPIGSLGRLEELSIQTAGITGQAIPRLRDKCVLVMAGDHGVVAEGVSAYPHEVTPQMVLNFLRGGAAINVLARHVGARVVVVDMGVAVDLPDHPGLLKRKVAYGTRNIARGAAMSREHAIQALESGIDVVEMQIAQGMDLLATGDMGIGNTTPSAAIAAALSGDSAADIAGRGTGVDDAGLQRKIAVIERALAINRPDPQDGIDILAKVGGFEIGGLAGAILAAAAHRRPVVVDGFISTAAAMIAVSLAPQTRHYLIAAHTSMERGHHKMMEWLGVSPLLDLKMRLGEGTGAALAMSLVEAACKTLAEMATFGEAGVSEKSAA
ncbi:MAG: nicotinate-nucleotide--dimethylbenzimidazole phosphoribosyltransferase [Anaerolineales bacterium]|nr:nicotinate-nucleotide--dimethylbenzimidazole phosphoribosyltransferase [Anaerolineales bacterium]